MPKATETFRDSFLPCIGISIILSANERIGFGSPLTSLPNTSAVFSVFFGAIFVWAMDFLLCSTAYIL